MVSNDGEKWWWLTMVINTGDLWWVMMVSNDDE